MICIRGCRLGQFQAVLMCHNSKLIGMAVVVVPMLMVVNMAGMMIMMVMMIVRGWC